jgi:hypothetical protein
MSDREYEQAEQLKKYWASLTRGVAGEAPREVDPEMATLSQNLAEKFWAPEPAFIEKLQRQTVAPTASSARTNRVRPLRFLGSRQLMRNLAIAAAFVLAFVGLCFWMTHAKPVNAQGQRLYLQRGIYTAL